MTPVPDCGEESYVGTGQLTDKVAVVTGADSGIGRAVAIAYAREGADVVISYLSEDSDAEDVRRLVKEAGRRAVLVKGDLADAAASGGRLRPGAGGPAGHGRLPGWPPIRPDPGADDAGPGRAVTAVTAVTEHDHDRQVPRKYLSIDPASVSVVHRGEEMRGVAAAARTRLRARTRTRVGRRFARPAGGTEPL